MKDELVNLIKSLGIENFNLLIKRYLVEYYETKEVHIVNGPYDGGLDLEIFVDGRDIKKNIQITIQKTDIYNKIMSDVEKSSINVLEYNYLAKLDYYISQPITKTQKNKLIRDAERKFQIDLKIVDANSLAEEAEDFPIIRDTILKIFNVDPTTEFIKIDNQSKILFDVLTSSKETIDIKKGFLDSIILSFLYENQGATTSQIFNHLNSVLEQKVDFTILKGDLNKLRMSKVIISKEDKDRYFLSDEKLDDINRIFQDTFNHEKNLEAEFKSFLANFNLESKAIEFANAIKNIYQENYQIDIEELKSTSNSHTSSLRRIFNELSKLIEGYTNNSIDPKEVAKGLLSICDENYYLNKLAVGLMFTKLYNNNLLEKYINQKKHIVILDTPILLRFLCSKFKRSDVLDDPFIKSVEFFFDSVSISKGDIELFTTNDYIYEIVGHIVEASKLNRFSELPYFDRLGKSKNIFFNYFEQLKYNDLIEDDENFSYFLDQLIDISINGYELMDSPENDDNYSTLNVKIFNRVKGILEISGIKSIKHDFYKDFEVILQQYENSLSFSKKEKTPRARKNDLRTMLFLSRHRNPSFDDNVEFFLITWDNTFYDFRKNLINSQTENLYNYWYIYSPLKFADRVSVMDFRLKPKSLNYNIITLAESNFNNNTKSTVFIDVISAFFNKRDLNDLGLINKLLDLKEKTESLNDFENIVENSDSGQSPVLDYLLDLREYYFSGKSIFKFQHLIELFENKNFENEIIQEFIKFSSNRDLDKQVFYQRFDGLIELNMNKKTTDDVI